ncbi:MAG: phosphotransferase [Halioglobus sp.]|nr:phosphotransferase [Halioglobus sp.]
MTAIPGTVDELTTHWLREVLGEHVQGSRLLDANSGTTGRAVLEVHGEDLPPRLFVKLPPTDEMQRLFVTTNGMGRKEVLFYSQLSGEVPVRVPHCYYSATDEAGEQYIMLLEHLEDSGCTFQNASSRYSLDYVRAMLNEFARLHAAYWETPRFATDLDWVTPPARHDIAVDLVGKSLAEHAHSMPPVFRQMGELFLANTDDFYRLWGEGAHTLVHGDAHDANLFYDGRPGFLDWAIVSKAPGMRDVGYFLAGTLNDEHRSLARELVGEYREALVGLGVSPPALEDLWQQCQWHAAYVWVGATVTLAMGDAWQPVSYVMSSLERLHAALEEFGSLGAIQRSVQA